MLNLEWYRTFKVVYETGTLSAAAQSLCISQPGVSLHLNSLESYTGFRLFERESRKAIPTDRAKILYDYIIDAVLKLEEIEKLVHGKSRTEKAVISIGMCYTTFQNILEEHISELPFKLITRFGECSQLIEDLNNGAIDFIITSQKSLNPNLTFRSFANERIILVAGGKTDISKLEKLTAADNKLAIKKWLGKQRWFATGANMEYLKSFWLSNFEELPDFSPEFILPFVGSIVRCLNNAEGFTVMPEFLCKREIQNNTIKLAWKGSPELNNTLHFGKRKKTIYPKEIEFLEQLLINHWI